MLRRLTVIVLMVLSGLAGRQAAAQQVIGAVTRIQGEASATRNDATRALSLTASVFLNEVVSTGEGARLEVTFADKTRLTLGGSAFLSSGSNPTTFYQPIAKMAITLSKKLTWNTEWRYYGFDESFYVYQGFRAQMVTTGVRLTR